MNNKVTDFLKEVSDSKKKQLMGIELDINYWGNIIGGQDVNKLREQLKVENEKKIVDSDGKITDDKRDMLIVNSLNEKIEMITKATQELAKLNAFKNQITNYLGYVANLSEDTLGALENIVD